MLSAGGVYCNCLRVLLCLACTIQWEVCCAALEILQLLLAEHQPAASNFTSGALADASHQQVQHGSSMDLGAPPGHTILLHMLNESPLLTKVSLLLQRVYRILGNTGQGTYCDLVVCEPSNFVISPRLKKIHVQPCNDEALISDRGGDKRIR